MVRFWVVDVPRHGLTFSAAEKDLICGVQKIIIETEVGRVKYHFDDMLGPVGLQKTDGDQLGACIDGEGITMQYLSEAFEVYTYWNHEQGLLGSVPPEIVQDFQVLWETLQWIFSQYREGNKEALNEYTFFMFREKEGELWVHLPRVKPVFEVVFDLEEAKAALPNFHLALQKHFESEQRKIINQQSSSSSSSSNIKQCVVRLPLFGLQFAYFKLSNDPSFLNDREPVPAQLNYPSKLVLLLPFHRQQQNLHSPPLLSQRSLLASSFSPTPTSTSPAALSHGYNHPSPNPPSIASPFNNHRIQFPQQQPPQFYSEHHHSNNGVQHLNNGQYLPDPMNPYWPGNYKGGGN